MQKNPYTATLHHAYSRRSQAYSKGRDQYDETHSRGQYLFQNQNGTHSRSPRSMAFKDPLLKLIDQTDDVIPPWLDLKWSILPMSTESLERILMLDPILCWFAKGRPLCLSYSLKAGPCATSLGRQTFEYSSILYSALLNSLRSRHYAWIKKHS